jgi:hypothetical protein
MGKAGAWSVAAVVLLAGAVGITWWVTSRDSAADPSWLFSHTADGGGFVDNGDGTYTLTLTGIDPHVLAFTDRPDRDAVVVDAAGLVGMWSDFFADSDPNAVLVEHGADGAADSIVMTLRSPSLDERGLTFTAVPLVDEVPVNLARIAGGIKEVPSASFAAASLFMDDAAPGSDCVTGDACESPVERGILCDLGYTQCDGNRVEPGVGGDGGEGGN